MLKSAAVLSIALVCVVGSAHAQGTKADYERAEGLRKRFEGLVTGVADNLVWTTDSGKVAYRVSVKGGFEFRVADPKAASKLPAFDHAAIAASLSGIEQLKTPDKTITAATLPFTTFTYEDGGRKIRFTNTTGLYACTLVDNKCEWTGPAPIPRPPAGNGMGPLVAYGTSGPRGPANPAALKSPDGKLEAQVIESNLWVRAVGERGRGTQVSYDGRPGDAYVLHNTAWSPDSKKIAIDRVVPGFRRAVTYVESSPADGMQPRTTELYYPKPGDVLEVRQPMLFDLEKKTVIAIDRSLFPNAYTQSHPTWWKDGKGFRIDYNQRGHQAYRIIDVDGATGATRVAIDEKAATYINYSGKHYLSWSPDESEAIWMSERDGWNHLYLVDPKTGQVKSQITKGAWAVRGVTGVDWKTRQVSFTGNGMVANQDPYFTHTYRIGIDGKDLVSFTEGDGTHTVTWSPDKEFYIDQWSRVDMAPVTVLRRASDQKAVLELEKGDLTALLAAGWKKPEIFVAKGRDGATDIWGYIVRPTNFDAKKKYPVIENIYAGPQDSFTPKSFAVFRAHNSQAELGFIVTQVDGMGTSNRSKAFQDVAWMNLADAGFPDRILWHKAIAAKYPSYDISRVGVYGGSAGGQNAMAALLFHPEFYKAAVASVGSHDNRMDKIWWNEQFMGWPIGPHYAASSNVDNAHKLQGKLLLIVGELDTNVDPSSTYQVVNALIKANKTFDFLMIPSAGHGEGGAYGERKRWDFFVQNLIGSSPPNRNIDVKTPTVVATTARR